MLIGRFKGTLFERRTVIRTELKRKRDGTKTLTEQKGTGNGTKMK